MKESNLKKALGWAVDAANAAGLLMEKNLNRPKKMNHVEQHDIKLELDVRCQKTIENKLLKEFPEAAILGEEGVSGDQEAAYRWVVDPIDGTVNFTYGIPHACVSIALQRRTKGVSAEPNPDAAYETVVGVVLDPFCHEIWTAIKGQSARLNGRKITVSSRTRLDESIITMGFAKTTETLNEMLPRFGNVIRKVRKVRIMGSAALALTYVASGRFEAYWEGGIRLWDIAAGGLIVECAGGEFWNEPVNNDHTYRVIASNGLVRKKLLQAAG